MKNGAENLQAHVNEAAAYGGHDGQGGHQKRRGNVSQSAPINQGTMRSNMMPQTGPATAGKVLTGPMGSGGASGCGN